MKKGKKYNQASKLIEKGKKYQLEEAIGFINKISISKFKGSIDAHIALILSDKEKKQSFRGNVTYPNTFGKKKRILVLTQGNFVKKALDAGADYAGLEDYIKKIQEGWFEFDIIISTPNVMPKIAVLGKQLGPKGLMPSPKNSTVTEKIEKIIKEYKQGKTSYKSDKDGNLHIPFAKVGFELDKIRDNFSALMKSLQQTINMNQIRSIYITPSMGPSIKLDLGKLEETT